MARRAKATWTPTNDDYNKAVYDLNPWNATGHVPEALAFETERPLAKCLWKRMQSDAPRRFQLLLGPRRVGKSTTMYQTIRHLLAEGGVKPNYAWRLDLGNPLLMTVPLNHLVKLIVDYRKDKSQPVYLFLDELTYAKDWDLWLKTFYDDKWPVRIVGSSSSTAALHDRKIESGIGRWDEQFMSPYLFTEYLELIGEPINVPVQATLYETLRACCEAGIPLEGLAEKRKRFLLTGGFPELLLGGDLSYLNEESALLQSQRVLRTDAVQSAIYKDIPQAFGVDSPTMLERLLYTLGGQFTGILSPNSICQTLNGMSQPTFDKYLSYLERAFLVFTLPNYSGTEAAVQRRGRKLYFVDGAVRNAALQRGLAPLNNSEEMGLLMENMIAGHMFALSQQTQVRLYHWREKQDEVDLIYDHPESPMAFEVGTGAGHHRRGLMELARKHDRFYQRCFVIGPDLPARMPFSETLNEFGTIPLDLFLLAVSAQAERELENNLVSCHRQA